MIQKDLAHSVLGLFLCIELVYIIA